VESSNLPNEKDTSPQSLSRSRRRSAGGAARAVLYSGLFPTVTAPIRSAAKYPITYCGQLGRTSPTPAALPHAQADQDPAELFDLAQQLAVAERLAHRRAGQPERDGRAVGKPHRRVLDDRIQGPVRVRGQGRRNAGRIAGKPRTIRIARILRNLAVAPPTGASPCRHPSATACAPSPGCSEPPDTPAATTRPSPRWRSSPSSLRSSPRSPNFARRSSAPPKPQRQGQQPNGSAQASLPRQPPRQPGAPERPPTARPLPTWLAPASQHRHIQRRQPRTLAKRRRPSPAGHGHLVRLGRTGHAAQPGRHRPT